MPDSHIFDAKNIDALEIEDRKIWRNPEEILGMLKTRPDFVAADLGCGSGFFTIPLSKRVKKVYGIDIQKQMLESLEKKVRKLKIENVFPLQSTENRIPLEDCSLDLLISISTLHEFRKREVMIEQIRRVLKQGGTATISDFKKATTDFGPPVAIRVSKQQAINLLENCGFRVLQQTELEYHYLLSLAKV